MHTLFIAFLYVIGRFSLKAMLLINFSPSCFTMFNLSCGKVIRILNMQTCCYSIIIHVGVASAPKDAKVSEKNCLSVPISSW